MKEEQLLKDLIKQGESEQLEFMEVVRKDIIAKNICAFLNAEGGRVLVGIAGDERITGLKGAQQIKDELQTFLLNQIVPEAPFTITIESIGQKEIIVIKVGSGSKQPYLFDGSIYYRKESRTQKASSKEISDLIHDRQISEKHWERQLITGVELDKLDKQLIITTIRESIKRKRSTYSREDILGFLTHYGLFVNGSFTNACVILFAKNPASFIPQVRVRLTEYAKGKTDDNLIRDEFFEGNLFDIQDKLEKYTNGLGIRSVFDKNQWKRIDFSFPKEALQEGIINALMHRDYSSPSSGVSISVYPDKFVIANSGKLPDGLTIKDLKKNHSPHPVNPDIAHMVFLRGLIDKIGRGTLSIISACKEAELRVPEWKETSSDVVLTFNGPKALARKKPDREAVNDTVNDAVNDAVRSFISDAVNDALRDAVNDAVINRLISEVITLLVDEGKSLRELMKDFNVARATMQRDIALLKAHQYVEFVGSPKSGLYKLTEKFRNEIRSIE